MEGKLDAAKVDNTKKLLEISAVAGRLNVLFANVKIILDGCIEATETIESLSHKLDQKLDDFESADACVRDEVGTLVLFLLSCSEKLYDAESFEDVMKVEVVNRLLFSTLQNFTVPLDGLRHLEGVTRDHVDFQRELSAFGYEGVTWTRADKLQIDQTMFMNSGKLALQNACRLEPLLFDEVIASWFWNHFRRLAICFYSWREYEGCMPWHEAALKVAKFEPHFRVISSRELGLSCYLAALGNASDMVDIHKKEEWSRRGIFQWQAFISSSDQAKASVNVSAANTSQAYRRIGDLAFFILKDPAVALENFTRGIEFAATNSLHQEVFQNILRQGTVIIKAMPDKLKGFRAWFHQSLELEAVLEAIPHADQIRKILEGIYNATVEERVRELPHNGSPPFELVVPSLSYKKPELVSMARSMVTVQFMPKSLIKAGVTACHMIGCAYYLESQFEKAIDIMLTGLRILDAKSRVDGKETSESQRLSAILHSVLGEAYYCTAKHTEAVRHFNLYNGQVLNWQDRMMLKEMEGKALFFSGEYLRALEVLKEVLSQILGDSELRNRVPNLLAWIGQVEFLRGDIEDCIDSLVAARRANEKEKTLDIQDLAVLHLNLVQAYLRKLDYRAAFQLVKEFQPTIDQYLKGEYLWQVWQAIKAAGHQMMGDLESADMDMEQVEACDEHDPKRDAADLMAVMARSSVYRGQTDIDSALEGYDRMEESIKHAESNGFRTVALDVHVPPIQALQLAEIHLNRAATLLYDLRDGPRLQRACHEAKQAVLLLREKEEDVLLARALACQAAAMMNFSFLKHAHLDSRHEELIDEAIALVENKDKLLLARFKHIKAISLESHNPSAAEAEGREAACIFADHQLKLRDMESAWVSMFGSEMKHLFTFMQLLSLRSLDVPLKALLWAERGRTRLFVYIARKLGDSDFYNVKNVIDTVMSQPKVVNSLRNDLEHVQLQNNSGRVSSSSIEWPGETDGETSNESQRVSRSTLSSTRDVINTYDNVGRSAEFSSMDELWFDRDDALAEKHLFEAVDQCGPGALVLEFTYLDRPGEKLLIYAVFITPEDPNVLKCEAVRVNVDALLTERQREVKKWIWGKTLAAVISKTREFIIKKADDRAVEGLSLLHSVLIESVDKYMTARRRLILCVHEQLALVPFAALFNKQSGKFLVQEKTISYIPSIRVLHYCFRRQQIFEQRMEKGALNTPFIAGNPEPMGWKMRPLPGAAEEAKLVAEMLGVEPCTGSSMTKEAVMGGLSGSSMVLLATHGVVDTYFPHGALILQDCSTFTGVDKSSFSTSLNKSTVSELRGHFFDVLRNAQKGTSAGNAAIISDELANLPGGIRAGLVVLSTCKSGEGKVTSEGLLGLGRALLQGGAPAAILALWEVADTSNKILIAGLFQQLVKQGKDVAEALRQVMLEMMEGSKAGGEKKYNIFHWAPLVALGTPIFKYAQGQNS